jgi:hypothetical protein
LSANSFTDSPLTSTRQVVENLDNEVMELDEATF